MGSLIRYILLAAAGIAAVTAVSLVVMGRLDAHSLLNAQGWFGLFLTLLVLSGSVDGPRQHVPFDSRDAASAAMICVMAAAACWRVLNLGFLSDDFVLLRHVLKEPAYLVPMFTRGGGDGFYRPIGNLSYVVTAWLVGGDAVSWHAFALGLHAVNSGLMYLLARKFGLGRLPALIAAALFAIHGTRPEAVAWVAARFDLLMMFFVLCGLLLYEFTVLAFLCMLGALLTKEAGYAFPLLLLLFGTWRKAAPFFVGAGAMFAYRWSLLGGIGGYKLAGSDDAAALHFGLLPAVKVLGSRLWSLLYVPVNRAVAQPWWLTVLTALYMGVLLYTAWHRVDRKQWIRATLFVIAACLPPLHQLLIGADMEKSRLLYLPVAGFCLMMGVLLDGQRERLQWASGAMVLVFHFAALQNNLNAWELASDQAAATLEKASACIGAENRAQLGAMPRTLHGVYFFANGFPEGLELLRGKPVEEGERPVVLWDAKRQQMSCRK